MMVTHRGLTSESKQETALEPVVRARPFHRSLWGSLPESARSLLFAAGTDGRFSVRVTYAVGYEQRPDGSPVHTVTKVYTGEKTEAGRDRYSEVKGDVAPPVESYQVVIYNKQVLVSGLWITRKAGITWAWGTTWTPEQGMRHIKAVTALEEQINAARGTHMQDAGMPSQGSLF